ncbi:11792_t:CDS:2, partial [Racocetra persica]
YDRTEYPLKIQTLEDYPSMYDLPISPPFGIFTAPVQVPSTPEGDNAAFRHHANVADATKCQPIISVARNSKTSDDKSIKDRKSRNEELEKLVEKFSPPPNKKQPRNVTKNINEDPQEESSSRAKRLKSAINQVNEIKENESAEVQHNTEVQHNAEVQHNTEVQHNAEVQHNTEVQHNAEVQHI